MDSTSLDLDLDFTEYLDRDIDGKRIGVPREYLVEGIEPGVRSAFDASIAVLEGLGAIVEETNLPLTDHALAVYYIIAPSEASANLARFDGVKYGMSIEGEPNARESIEATRGSGFGPEVKRRILIGTYALSAGYYDAYYKKAQQVRTLIRREFQDAFQKFDALVMPTSPTVAFELGEKTQDPFQMYLSDVCTIPVNIAGLPGISVPCGLSEGSTSRTADSRASTGRPHRAADRARLRAIGQLEADTTRTMKNLTALKPSFVNLIVAISIVALAAVFACTSESEEDTATLEPEVGVSTAELDCPDLEVNPDTIGDAPLGPPPALPNIFTGTAYVNGEPVPEGEQLYVKLVTSRSRSVDILEGGKFINIIHGPVSELDQGIEFQFCLGDPEGIAVKSIETFEFDGNEPFKESDVELNFPMLPSELNAAVMLLELDGVVSTSRRDRIRQRSSHVNRRRARRPSIKRLARSGNPSRQRNHHYRLRVQCPRQLRHPRRRRRHNRRWCDDRSWRRLPRQDDLRRLPPRQRISAQRRRRLGKGLPSCGGLRNPRKLQFR